MRIIHKFLLTLAGTMISTLGFAAATGVGVLTACAPTGGVKGYCKMTKGFADPQTVHSEHCELTKDNVVKDSHIFPSHSVPANTGHSHQFPSPELSTAHDEGVTFCVINIGYWWTPTVPASHSDCRTTRSG